MASETSFNDLPVELVADILSRLPVRKVIQFICLRKVWRSVIESPSFVSLHHSRSLLNPSNYYIFLVHAALFEVGFGLISDSPRITCLFSDQFNIEALKEIEIRGACKGLVCLTDSYGRNGCIYLINPFIRKCKKLEGNSSCYANLIDRSNVVIGFGYSDTDDDYKVLRIIRVLGKKRKTTDANNNGCYYVEIYSLKSRQWKIVDFSDEVELPVFSKSIYAHGCLYWCVNDEEHTYLLCFSLKDEFFNKIALPETYFNLSSRRGSRIFNKNDSVVVVLYNDLRYQKTKITLLVMEKNADGHVQWIELSYSDSEDELSDDEGSDDEGSDYADEYDGLECPLGFSADGRLIFETSRRKTYRKKRQFVSVDLNNSCTKEKLGFRFDTKLQKQNGWPEDIENNDGVTNVMESLVLFSDRIG